MRVTAQHQTELQAFAYSISASFMDPTHVVQVSSNSRQNYNDWVGGDYNVGARMWLKVESALSAASSQLVTIDSLSGYTRNWQSTYTTVLSNSAAWGARAGLSGFTRNWQSTYITVSGSSASWTDVYNTVNSNSAGWQANTDSFSAYLDGYTSSTANWTATYETVNSSSAGW
jgi:hypothetical protein